jgi:hypothetical protein
MGLCKPDTREPAYVYSLRLEPAVLFTSSEQNLALKCSHASLPLHLPFALFSFQFALCLHQQCSAQTPTTLPFLLLLSYLVAVAKDGMVLPGLGVLAAAAGLGVGVGTIL